VEWSGTLRGRPDTILHEFSADRRKARSARSKPGAACDGRGHRVSSAARAPTLPRLRVRPELPVLAPLGGGDTRTLLARMRGVHLEAGTAVEFEQFRPHSSQRRHCWSHAAPCVLPLPISARRAPASGFATLESRSPGAVALLATQQGGRSRRGGVEMCAWVGGCWRSRGVFAAGVPGVVVVVPARWASCGPRRLDFHRNRLTEG